METKTLHSPGSQSPGGTSTHDTGKESDLNRLIKAGNYNLINFGDHNSIQVGQDNGPNLETINDLIKQLAGCNIVVNIYFQKIGNVVSDNARVNVGRDIIGANDVKNEQKGGVQ